MAAPYLRHDRRTPSPDEAEFLQLHRLSLASLEFELPRQLAASEEFIAVAEAGNARSAVYSSHAFQHHRQQAGLGGGNQIQVYVLPHLPLADADELAVGYNVANPHRIYAKLSERVKINQARAALRLLLSKNITPRRVEDARGSLARALDGVAAGDGNNVAAAAIAAGHRMTLGQAEAFLINWKEQLATAREAAEAARGPVILAVHLATSARPPFSVDVGAFEPHVTAMLHLVPTLHDTIYAAPGRADLCIPAAQRPDDWTERVPRTRVQEQQALRSFGLAMEPEEFITFSLASTRRRLVDCLVRVSKLELLVTVFEALTTDHPPMTSLLQVFNVLEGHLIRPTLLGCEVGHHLEQLPMHSPFYPSYAHMSPLELNDAVRGHFTAPF